MNKLIICILLAIFAIPSFGQSISIFDIDTTNFPTMKAKFYAFDKDGKPTTPKISDLKLTENGINRTITNVICPPPKPPKALSSVLVIDVSSSMNANNLGVTNMDLAKSAANVWVNTIDLNQSECAVTSFDDKNYLNQDFTSDRNRLLSSIAPLGPKSGTNYDAALLLPLAGGLQVSKNGKHKKIIVLITDGNGGGTETKIIEEANKQNCTIYCVTIKMKAPEILKNISLQTGGQYFENVKTVEDAEKVYKMILYLAEYSNPCELTWESGIFCLTNKVNVELDWNNIKSIASYTPSVKSLAKLDVVPNNINFGFRNLNSQYDTIVTFRAINSDISINNIKLRYGSTNFSIVNTIFPIYIAKNTSKDITLRYYPTDSSMIYTAFDIETNFCLTYLSASGGFPNYNSKQNELKLTSPNGKEEFVIGSDTVITWTGVSPNDTVSLEYSIDSGKTWKSITKKATGLKYNWSKIPRPTSQKCLVRVQLINYNFPPKIEWQRNYGGSFVDSFEDIQLTKDSCYIAIGWTNSKDGDVIGIVGDYDFWVCKLNLKGNIIWQKCLGGFGYDKGVSISVTKDGGYVLAGVTTSKDALVSKNSTTASMLVYKLDASGNVEWQKCFGGNKYDNLEAIRQTIDEGFIMIGFRENDVRENRDYSVVKIDKLGNLEWQRYYGGTGYDWGTDIIQTNDNGYIMIGESFSYDGDITNRKGGNDMWVVKINPNGNIEWEKSYGGTFYEYGKSIRQTKDNGYIIAGYATSEDKDVANKVGNDFDYWVVKIDSIGKIEWQKTYGGKNAEYVESIELTSDNGYIIIGSTRSRDSQINNFKDSTDFWIVKIDSKGNIEWQSAFGGTNYDEASSIKQSLDGGYIVAGSSSSRNGDITNYKWSLDAWAFKLSPDRQILQQDISDTLFSIVAPSPASKDIDMKKCVVGRIKDSTINDFVINNGKYQFGVDSIYFTGADAVAFSLVSGLPKYNVLGNSNEFAEIRFTPNRIGIHSAKVNIITTYDTLVQNIIGEGVASGIEVINNLIDFGNVSLGNFKDSLQAVTIRNISASDILITNIKQSGPNYTDFSILSNNTNILLKAGDTLRLDLKYTPSFDGKVNGSLSFEFNEIGSPAYVQLYGRGIDAKAILSADSSSAFTKKEAKVTLRLTNMDKLIEVGNTHISAELVYNKTMLFPKTIMNRTVEGDSIVIKLDSLPLIPNPKNELTILKFTATLGNAEETSLNLRNVKMIGADANITVVNGNFKLLGVCYEGGERFLVGNKSKSMLLAISPNPATESIEIEYSNADEGEAEIIISNLLGQTILTQKLEKTQTGFAKIDLSQLPTGQYSILFKTETVLENRMIQVIK